MSSKLSDDRIWVNRGVFSCGLMLVFTALQGCANNGVEEGRGSDGPLNASYTIAGQTITLVDGYAELPRHRGPARKSTPGFGAHLRLQT